MGPPAWRLEYDSLAVCSSRTDYIFWIQVSLDKLRGAEGQVTVMQREMEAVQPKLAEASKEVDASMSNMEKEQVWKFKFNIRCQGWDSPRLHI